MRGRNPFRDVVRPQGKGNRSPNRSRLNSFNPRARAAAAAASLSSPPSAPQPSTDPISHLQRCQVLLRNLASLRSPPWYYKAEVSDRRRRKRVSPVCLSVCLCIVGKKGEAKRETSIDLNRVCTANKLYLDSYRRGRNCVWMELEQLIV